MVEIGEDARVRGAQVSIDIQIANQFRDTPRGGGVVVSAALVAVGPRENQGAWHCSSSLGCVRHWQLRVDQPFVAQVAPDAGGNRRAGPDKVVR